MKTNLVVGVLVGLAELAFLWGMDLAGVLQSDLGARLLQFMLFFHALGLIVAMVRVRQVEGAAIFARLLGAGLMVTFVAAVTAGAGNVFFLNVVEPGYLDWVMEQTREDIADWPEDRKAQAEEQIAATTPAVYATRGAMYYLVRGLLLSLLLAAVLRLRILRGSDLSDPAGAEPGGTGP